MKHKIVLISLLMALCALSNGKMCYKRGTNSNEKYCDDFTGPISRRCIPLKEKKSSFDASDFGSYSNLRFLRIGGCSFDEVLSLIGPETHTLDISHSKYSELKRLKTTELWIEYSNLKQFNASYNEIREIPQNYFENSMPNLLILDFSNNQIKSIEVFTFEGAELLATIDLSHNKIVQIENDAFIKLKNLEFIDLSSNLITSVNNLFEKNSKLKILLLTGNPIKQFACDFAQIAQNGGAAHFPWESIPIASASQVCFVFR